MEETAYPTYSYGKTIKKALEAAGELLLAAFIAVLPQMLEQLVVMLNGGAAASLELSPKSTLLIVFILRAFSNWLKNRNN
jgi:hypothetical protein